MSGRPANPDGGRVRVPADVDRPDTLLAGLTARQLAILAVAAVAIWAAYVAARLVVPLAVFAGLAVPVAGVAVTLALGRRDGLGADRLAAAALRQARRPRRMVLAPNGVNPPPTWAGQPSLPLPAPLALPLTGIGGHGVIDLGADGAALVCRAAAVTFALRTPAEQQGLVAGFARWLNSLDQPAQILVRATPVDLAPTIRALEQAAGGLPHPGLEAACVDHARFLADLAAGADLLTREVLVVLREPCLPGRAEDAAAALRRRAQEATSALAAAGVTLAVLDSTETTACLSRCLDPAGPPRPAGLAAPDAVITAAGGGW